MKELDFRQKAMLYILRMDCIKSIEQAVELTYKRISVSKDKDLKGIADYILIHAINAGHEQAKGVRMIWKHGNKFSTKRAVYSVIRELSQISKIVDISDIYAKFDVLSSCPYTNKMFFTGVPVSKYYVYIIKCADYYKIGYTSSLRKRISMIITNNPLNLELYGVFAINKLQDAADFEKELHSYFKNKRYRNEWFVLNEEDLLDISSMRGFTSSSLKY